MSNTERINEASRGDNNMHLYKPVALLKQERDNKKQNTSQLRRI